MLIRQDHFHLIIHSSSNSTFPHVSTLHLSPAKDSVCDYSSFFTLGTLSGKPAESFAPFVLPTAYPLSGRHQAGESRSNTFSQEASSQGMCQDTICCFFLVGSTLLLTDLCSETEKSLTVDMTQLACVNFPPPGKVSFLTTCSYDTL